MSNIITSCQIAVSTPFTFVSPGYQSACNNIYVNRSTTDAFVQNARQNNTNYIKFKTDLERMQYLMGQFNQKPSCQRS
jgi:hypothetical protein